MTEGTRWISTSLLSTSLGEEETTSVVRRRSRPEMKAVHIEAVGLMKMRAREAIRALTACATTEERSPACQRRSSSACHARAVRRTVRQAMP